MDIEWKELRDELKRWQKAYEILFAVNENHIRELEEARTRGWEGANQRVLDMFERRIVEQAEEIEQLKLELYDANRVRHVHISSPVSPNFTAKIYCADDPELPQNKVIALEKEIQRLRGILHDRWNVTIPDELPDGWDEQ